MAKTQRGPRNQGSVAREMKWVGVLATLLMAGLAPPVLGGDVKDVVRDLYGGDGIRLSQASGFNHDAHFTTQSLQGLDQLSSSLASSVGFLSFNSVVTGFVFDIETGEPVRTTDSLGPLVAEDATTLGKGKLNLGFSYTRVHYTDFEGTPLTDLSLRLKHPDVNGDGKLAPFEAFPGGPIIDAELDQVLIKINLELDQDIVALYGNYGLTPEWDVGVIVPIIHTRATASAKARVLDGTPDTPSPHFFEPGVGDPPGDSPYSSITREQTGIGDVVLRTKYNFLKGDSVLPDMAAGGQLTLPTGDKDNLIGIGETRLQAVFIASKRIDHLRPHVNLGYEWVPNDSELNSVRYIVGADMAVNQRITLAFDVLGRWEHNGDGIGDNQVDFAIGVKINLFETTLLTGNVIFPLNEKDGLRADVIWTIGIEHTF
jgi:Putative MetA-pathway of phenol degradation